MVQLHFNKWSETAESFIFYNRFPVRLETTLCSSSGKIAVGFTIIGKVSVTTCASINKRGTDLFTKDIFKPEQSV